jgi:type II secretory pathway pseudopilin PulG
MRRCDKYSGFTVVELFVVVLIIALVVAFVLPAIQSAREASRRTQCINNLKQIGLGLTSHASVFGHYPFGIRPDGTLHTGAPFALPSPLSIHFQILPYIEQASLFNSINFPGTAKDALVIAPVAESPANFTAKNAAVLTFLCPSDSGRLRPGCNYRGNIGPNPYTHDGLIPQGGGGVFPGLTAVADRDITDGASYTAGFSERLRGNGDPNVFSTSKDVWLTGLSLVQLPGDSTEMARACAFLTASSPDFLPYAGRRWILSGLTETLYNHVAVPNSKSPDCSVSNSQSEEEIMTGGSVSARSAHPGGVNVLMMDVGVRYIRGGVELQVWRALGSRAGGEVLDASF